jgi:hypothetical protein
MSSADSALISQNATRGAPATESRPILRIALYPGELLRIPRARRHLHVLSGAAWISAAGQDEVVSQGSCLDLARSRHPALVSGLGDQPLLFEVW